MKIKITKDLKYRVELNKVKEFKTGDIVELKNVDAKNILSSGKATLDLEAKKMQTTPKNKKMTSTPRNKRAVKTEEKGI